MPSEIDSLLKTIQCRETCLQTIVNNPQEKRELAEAIDTPRSTLDDIVRELENVGLVEYRNGRWEATPLGKSSLDTYNEYKAQIRSVVEAAPLFSEVSREVVDTRFLMSSNLYKADSAVPDKVLQVFFDAIEDATTLRWFAPVWFLGYSERFYRKVTSQDDCCIELTISSEVFDYLKQSNPKIINTLMNEREMSLYVGEVSEPYGLWICDNELAGVTICSERKISGVITNKTCEAVDWAKNQYDCIKRATNQLSSEDNHLLVSNPS